MLPYFFLFLFLSVVIFLLSKTGASSFFQPFFDTIASPFSVVYSIANIPRFVSKDAPYEKLQEENYSLRKQLVNQQELQKENQALKDQFESSAQKPLALLPAKIIGVSTFIPGVTIPESFILDKGASSGVEKGNAVVVKDNAIGKIIQVGPYRSEVELLTNKASSLAVVDSSTNALGILKGQGVKELILGNVLLSEALNSSDILVTKGEENIKGQGYPKGLIVGKILSIDKKPSNLFQSAIVESFVDFSRLSTVFIIIEK